MARRTITEREIALIKAMLSRGMKNRSIQFFFTRPDRPVNSGRISTIGSGSYSNSADIAPAVEEDLDAFIESVQASRNTDSLPGNREPTVSERATSLFERSEDGGWTFSAGEHEQCECKQDFDPKKMIPIVRAVAALANNKEGFIFFGVENSNFRVQGASESFSKTDIVQIVEKVKSHLSPTPTIASKGEIVFSGLSVGFLYVEKHPNPPVIVYRDGDGLNEGEILFRYPGQSARIKFGDLRALLDERDRKMQLALAATVGRIADIGTSNALILDTNKNVLEGKAHPILIDQELAESLKFIKEGEFDEKLGAPTLKLVGEVSPIAVKGMSSSIVSHTAIFQEDILEKFLTQTKVDQPIQYIYAGLAQSRLWLPIFYFARMIAKSNAEIADLVDALKISQLGKKKMLVERLNGQKTAFAKATTKAATKFAEQITKGSIYFPTSIEDVVPFSQGLTAAKKTTASLEDLLKAVQKGREFAELSNDGNAMGVIFKAACRIDELFFA